MARLTKNKKQILDKFSPDKLYSVEESVDVLKSIVTTKFDSSVDIAIRLGVDPRKANQMVRGIVTLPHGTGKNIKVLVICTPEKEEEARNAGAEFVGMDEYIKKIEGGWTDVDVIITMPALMSKIGRLGRVLGPRGLMPNPKTGTVTTEIGKAVDEVKKGKIDFKVDKSGIIHTAVAKASFDANKIVENTKVVLDEVNKLKPSSVKGTYIISISISGTMSPGISIDPKLV